MRENTDGVYPEKTGHVIQYNCASFFNFTKLSNVNRIKLKRTSSKVTTWLRYRATFLCINPLSYSFLALDSVAGLLS